MRELEYLHTYFIGFFQVITGIKASQTLVITLT